MSHIKRSTVSLLSREAKYLMIPIDYKKINVRGTERRYLTIGKAFKVLMTVIYTVRNLAFRIISVRRSRKDEREAYLTNSLTKQDDEHE